MKKLVGIIAFVIFFGLYSTANAQGAPSISSISPSTASPGETVYVYGSNFNQNTWVVLNEQQYIVPEYISSTTLAFPAPSLITTHTIQVISQIYPVSNSVTLKVVPPNQPPSISYIGPTTATVGTTIYVYGSNFNSHTFVALNGNDGPVVTTNYISPTSLSFVVPSGIKLGNNAIQVGERASSYQPSNTVWLNVIATPQPPAITYIAPTSATAGTRINVYGYNFNRNTFAFLTARVTSGQGGSGPYVSTMYHSPTHISFELPSNLEWVGTYNVQVNETASSFSPSNPVPLAVVEKTRVTIPTQTVYVPPVTNSDNTTTLSEPERQKVIVQLQQLLASLLQQLIQLLQQQTQGR